MKDKTLLEIISDIVAEYGIEKNFTLGNIVAFIEISNIQGYAICYSEKNEKFVKTNKEIIIHCIDKTNKRLDQENFLYSDGELFDYDELLPIVSISLKEHNLIEELATLYKIKKRKDELEKTLKTKTVINKFHKI